MCTSVSLGRPTRMSGDLVTRELGGGRSPLPSISGSLWSRERKRCASASCGQVLPDASPSQSLHQKVCSTSAARCRACRCRSCRDLLRGHRRRSSCWCCAVAPDDEVGCAVVAADDRVQDRLAGPRSGNFAGDAEDDPVLRVVLVHQHLVAAHPHVGRDVAGLGLADQRWMKSPSQVSRAALVRYSWARWIGLRVWNATIFFQTRASSWPRAGLGVLGSGA